jgi:hypothetical protein
MGARSQANQQALILVGGPFPFENDPLLMLQPLSYFGVLAVPPPDLEPEAPPPPCEPAPGEDVDEDREEEPEEVPPLPELEREPPEEFVVPEPERWLPDAFAAPCRDVAVDPSLARPT